jgi:formyltetrahydrofolate deformylase
VLFNHKLNVISNGEFVERNFRHFFMRTEFSGDFAYDALLEDLKNVLRPDANITLRQPSVRNICLLASREHHCLSDLLVRHAFGELDARVQCVISNHQNLEELTAKFSIPFHFINHEGKSREEHESEIQNVLNSYEPEFLVLARYMRVLTPAFVSRYWNRIVNIHHSFLPAFAGANPYAQAYDRGVKIIGATAHFVNDNLDEGPIIAQSVIPVDHSHSPTEMAQAGRDVEKIVLARALKLVLNDKLFVYRNKTIIFD